MASAAGTRGYAPQSVSQQRGRILFAPVESEFVITSPEEISHVVTSFAPLHPDGAPVSAAAFTKVRPEAAPQPTGDTNGCRDANRTAFVTHSTLECGTPVSLGIECPE